MLYPTAKQGTYVLSQRDSNRFRKPSPCSVAKDDVELGCLHSFQDMLVDVQDGYLLGKSSSEFRDELTKIVASEIYRFIYYFYMWHRSLITVQNKNLSIERDKCLSKLMIIEFHTLDSLQLQLEIMLYRLLTKNVYEN